MDNRRGNLQNYLCNRTAIISTGFPATETGLRQQKNYFLLWFLVVRDFFHYLGHSNYEIVVSPDRKWEIIHPNGTWGGVIGMVKNGDADMGMCATITDKRLSAVDFASPLEITKLAIVTKEPIAHTNETYFLTVYSLRAFLCIFITLFVVTILSLLFDTIPFKPNGPRLTLLYIIGNTPWRSLKMLFGETQRSRILSVNVLSLTWLLALQVFVSVYENFIAAEFTLPNKEKTIDSGEDLLDAVVKGKMTWGTFQNVAFETTLQTATEGILQKLWKVSAPHWLKWRATFTSKPYDRVLKQNYAFVSSEGGILVNSYNRTGQYHISTSGFLLILDTFVISKSSPFREVINFYILSAREFGILKKWEKEVEMVARRFEDPNGLTNDAAKQLELQTMKYVFWFLLAGLILSIAVFLIEVLTTIRLNKTSKLHKKGSFYLRYRYSTKLTWIDCQISK